ASAIDALSSFAQKWRDLPTLGYTHFQPAQLTTVGKRATLWAQDLAIDLEECEQLDRMVTERFGFTESFAVTGQTYPRKIDAQIVSSLAGIAATVHRFCNDIRLLAGMKQIEEPFESE